MRNDNKEEPVLVTSESCNKVLSRELVNLFKNEGAVKIFTVEALGIPQDPDGGVLRYDDGHVNHFHVSFDNPNPPDGIISLNATLPEQESPGLWSSTITTASPIKDKYGFNLFEGFSKVLIKTDEGSIYIGGVNKGQSEVISVISVNGEEGHITFQLKRSVSGKATINVETKNTYNRGQAAGSVEVEFP